MLNELMVEALNSIYTIFDDNPIEYDGSSLNIRNYNSQSVENCAEEDNTFTIELVQPQLRRYFDGKWSDDNGFDKGSAALLRRLKLFPSINFLCDIEFLFTLGNLLELLGHLHHNFEELSTRKNDHIVHLYNNLVEEHILDKRVVYFN